MRRYYYSNKPKYIHNCTKCKFIKSIRKDNSFTIDIYESCEGSMTKYLVRFSSDPSDYTTPSIDIILMHYAEVVRGGENA